MSRKVLYTATTDLHIINFHIPYLKWFKDSGYEVHVACNGDREIKWADRVIQIPFNRSPLGKNNLDSYFQLKDLVNDTKYDLIHCHTPTCGVITRLASIKARNNGSKILYTAHGFHFYQGAGFKSWLLFFPVEAILSAVTDGIIAINNEDYRILSSKWFLSKGKHFIPGIGVDPTKFNNDQVDRSIMRSKLGLKSDDIVFLYIAQFIPRKNHEFIFKNIKPAIDRNPKIHFLFAGGFSTEKQRMEKYAISEGIIDKVHFLGYQENIDQFIKTSDVALSSSRQEGLPMGIAEMMFHELPVLASDIRGHQDLIQNGENGYLFKLNNPNRFQELLLELASSNHLRKKFGTRGKMSLCKFSIDNTRSKMKDIYNIYLTKR